MGLIAVISVSMVTSHSFISSFTVADKANDLLKPVQSLFLSS